MPAVSFDFFFTKSDGAAQPLEEDPGAIMSLIMVRSRAGFSSCVPVHSKNQAGFVNRESLFSSFSSLGIQRSFCTVTMNLQF